MSKKETIKRATHGASQAYFLMSRSTAQDESLTWEARGVLSYLLSKPNDWLVVLKDLQQNCGRDKVRKIIRELIEHGYLEERQEIRDEKTGRIKGYTPHIVHETPLTDLPYTDNQHTDNQHTENTPLHNTDIQNTDLENKDKHSLSPTVDTAKQDSNKETKPDKSASSDTKKEKPLDPIIVWAAKHVFEVDPRKTTKSVKFMIGNWRNGIKEVHKLHDTDASTIYLDMWKEYYLKDNDNVSLPRDRKKLEAQYSKWYDHMKAQQSKTITPPPATWSQDVDIEFELPPVLKPRRSASNE